ncbi:MAG: S1C family serine protease [Acidimicrobiia bacterium]
MNLRRGRTVVVLALLLTACSNDASVTVQRSLEPSASTTTPDQTAPTTSDTPAGELSAKAVLAAIGPSIAFVETPSASGSGVLLDNGFVLTNLHVIEPYRLVDLHFDGLSTSFTDVPVVGVDYDTDIAVLGPITIDRPALTLADPSDLAKGDQLYLVGYPGEVDAEPEVTITSGILSRVRLLADYEQTYLQTDAAIAGGQSGGALVDGRGRVVGISGLSFAETFALALSASNAAKSVESIQAGRGDAYETFPETGTTTTMTAELRDIDDQRIYGVHTGPAGEQLKLTFGETGSPLLWVSDDIGGDVFLSSAAIAFEGKRTGEDAEAIDQAIKDAADNPDAIGTEVSPTEFTFDLEPDSYYRLWVASSENGPASISITTSIPVAEIVRHDDRVPLTVPAMIDAQIGYLEDYRSYVLDLTDGQSILVEASSPSSDMAFVVIGPGQNQYDGFYVDDSGEGLYGVDAGDTFTATTTGQHRILVYSMGGNGTSFRLAVTAA